MSTIRRILEAGATDICTKQANFKRNVSRITLGWFRSFGVLEWTVVDLPRFTR